MVCALALSAFMAADGSSVRATLAGGAGSGLSFNSTTVYVVPMATLNVDVDFGGWYAGGGLESHTYIDPQFPTSSILEPMAVDLVGRVGLVPLEIDRFRVLTDASLLLGTHYIVVRDGQSYFGPSVAGGGNVRGEWEVADQVSIQVAVGLMATLANFGLLEFVPHGLIGVGYHFR